MVVQTRRKRKQISYYEADSDEDDEAMEEIELALDAAQGKCSVCSRQTKKKAKSPTKAPFSMIPDELLPKILNYLDNARDVYNLSKMNKSLRIAISPELVIRTAVFSGNQYASALRVLMCEISNQRIRVPSTLRLLRLINAKSCERGKECFCYNLETETSGPLILDGMRPYGMAICTPCVHALSSCWGNDCPGSLRSEAICTHGWSRVLCYPQVEQATGEAVGPMILFRDIKQIQYSYSDNEKREEVLKSTIASAEAQAFGPEEEARIDRFCVAYVEAKRKYEAHCEALRRIAKEKEEQRVAKRAAQKQRLAGVVFQKLESHFAGFQYESLILNRDWNYNHAAFYFHHWPSTFALGRLIQAPSYATQKKITEAATRAKWLYTRLEDLGFLGDAFPSQLQRWLRAHGNLPMHKKALVRYFAEFKSSLSMLPSDSCWNVSALSIYEAMLQEDRAKMVLEVLSPEECRDAFANEVTRETNRNSSRQKRLQLAKRIWTIHNTQQWNRERLFRYSASDLGLYGQRFSVARTDFNQTLRKIIRYKKHPDTKAWIRQTISSGNFSALLTPGDAIDTLYEGKFGPSGSSGGFDEWRRHHAFLVRVAYVSGEAD